VLALQIADVGLELLPDGLPAYRQVAFTVPRQSGKTMLLLAWEVQRAIGWAPSLGPQRIAYSAQTGKDVREKLLEDQVPLLERNKQVLGMQKVTRTNGSESILWRNGSRIVLLASGSDSGHGKTIDLGIEDELFADSDHRRAQALNPAMATRPHAQRLIASTMGTAESVALNTAVTAGRKSVERGDSHGILHTSNGPRCKTTNLATRQSGGGACRPSDARSRSASSRRRTSLPLEEFRRAYLNIATTTLEDRVISRAKWEAVCSEDAQSTGEIFAFDVNPERSAAAIVAVGPGPTIEVVEYRPGVAWLVERITELSRQYRASVAFDRQGPAGSFAAQLERQYVELIGLDGKAVQRACGSFYDAVIAQQLSVRISPDLDRAVEGASKREFGDLWVWGRKSSRFDISLLVAATCGTWALANRQNARIPLASFG